MNEGQNKFYDFILDRVKPDETEKAKVLLYDHFAKQAEGTFDKESMMHFVREISTILKPEFMDEVSAVFDNFGSQHISK